MEPCISALITLIKQQDIAAVYELYENSTEPDNILQLKFIYQSAQQNPQVYGFYQDLCEQLAQRKTLPTGLIAGINDSDRFNFFTPSLKHNGGFSQKNAQGNTVLHVLFANPSNILPPFNYIRSLLLFESNEGLIQALQQRNQQQLTAIECYFAYNPHFSALPRHELSAILALIEAQAQLISQQSQVLAAICKRLKQCNNATKLDSQNHRVLLLATTYNLATKEVLSLLSA
ncbi:hypothetical protein J8L98_16440 [Pseudoalteromonas sp. MMG013]|uniref:hypothetical protein n=1 Tax=Pseudoalteromonas sp. MMG013 TaxID=2822687 RepID=UPI001B38EEA6|nr:hypothetical protein [Pseudoalteromonas sp. MMG013]MBQ4863274.1 hypothetical protein [Pseudoalteromonas sp. MMG013]